MAARAAEHRIILLREFGNWCYTMSGYYWWDLGWLASWYFGAKQNQSPPVVAWSEPLAQAFVAGAWYLIWTPDVLFWVAKPEVRVERDARVWRGRRLHCDDGPAISSDVENLYFIHGVLVPAHVVVCPDKLCVQEIEGEQNAEVRRIMIERFGWVRYLAESGAEIIDRRISPRDQLPESLYQLKNGQKRVVVCDPSTGRRYALGVPRDVASCEQAVNWMSHGLDRFALDRT